MSIHPDRYSLKEKNLKGVNKESFCNVKCQLFKRSSSRDRFFHFITPFAVTFTGPVHRLA